MYPKFQSYLYLPQQFIIFNPLGFILLELGVAYDSLESTDPPVQAQAAAGQSQLLGRMPVRLLRNIITNHVCLGQLVKGVAQTVQGTVYCMSAGSSHQYKGPCSECERGGIRAQVAKFTGHCCRVKPDAPPHPPAAWNAAHQRWVTLGDAEPGRLHFPHR